jgi:hypothetical protein
MGRLPVVATLGLGIVLFLVLTGLAAAGVHLVMRAFESK